MSTMLDENEIKISLKEWIRGEFVHVNNKLGSLETQVKEMNNKLDAKLEEYDDRMNKVENRFSTAAVIQTTITTIISVAGGILAIFWKKT